MTLVRYRDTPTGRFEHADHLGPTLTRLPGDDWWQYTPDANAPMRFVRPDGSVISPPAFLTDLGTVPRWARIGRLLQPDALPAVALIHDWVVRRNNCGDTSMTFDDSNRLQQEALKTWMEAHPADRSRLVFYLSQIALRTNRSCRGWAYRFAECPPTLDQLKAAKAALRRWWKPS